jgi:hypothetical protein
MWVKRISQVRKPTHLAIRARIKLRNEFNREPSVAKIQEYLLHHPTAPVTHREVCAALRAGEEVCPYVLYHIEPSNHDTLQLENVMLWHPMHHIRFKFSNYYPEAQHI